MKKVLFLLVMVTLTLTGVWSAGAAEPAGKENVRVISKFDYLHGASIQDVLRKLKSENRKVTIVLKNGATYTGDLDEIKAGKFVQVLKLSGKEFYNALVLTDEIAAIEYRAKE